MEVTLDQIKNMAVRLCKKTIYYFNSDGIYCSVSIDDYENGKADFLKNVYCFGKSDYAIRHYFLRDSNINIFIKAISQLNVGNTFAEFERIYDSTEFVKHEKPQGLDRFIAKIDRPIFSRIPENTNTKTFDYIHVDVFMVSEDVLPNRDEFIKQNKKKILQKVLEKIGKSYQFQRYGVPINILKVSLITLIKNKGIVRIVFEVKNAPP